MPCLSAHESHHKVECFVLLDTNCQRLPVSHRKIGCGITVNILLIIVVAPFIDEQVVSICIGECVLTEGDLTVQGQLVLLHHSVGLTLDNFTVDFLREKQMLTS